MTDTATCPHLTPPNVCTVCQELHQLRHDLAACADKLATASGHLSLVAARQPERFWTRTAPTVPGWYWWRFTEADLPGIHWVDEIGQASNGPHRTLHVSVVGGFWCGPLVPPTLMAPE